ncbi:MAG: glycosyltransferase [bacterium]|nr:glycosyltransferase [bacterium]
MKNILIAAFSEVSTDSRILRYISSIANEHHVILAGCGKKPDLPYKFDFIDIGYTGKRKNKTFFDFIDYNLILKIKLYKIIKRISPDIIHANDFETLLPSYFAFINSKSKIIYDSHEIWTERAGVRKNLSSRAINYIEMLLEKAIIHKINKVMTVSETISSYLSSKYKIRRPVVIKNIPLPSAAEVVIAEENKKLLDKLENKIKFVYTGPISKERNIPFLVSFFSNLENLNIHLLLIGKNFLKSSSAVGNITFIDQVPENHLLSLLKLCDVGVHPLRTDDCLNHKYALPNKVFQYMQSGLALFVFKNAETDNIIDSYKCGKTSSFSNEKDTRASLEEFMRSDLNMMQQNSLNAYSDFLRRESPGNLYKSIIEKFSD